MFNEIDKDLQNEPMDVVYDDEQVLAGTARFIPLNNVVSPMRDGSNQGGITGNSSERPSNPIRFQDTECFY